MARVARRDSFSSIAKAEGISIRTIKRWSRQGPPIGRPPSIGPELVPVETERPYAYLLGLYLGDGHLARVGRAFDLRITLDARYPSIVREAEIAMAAVMPKNRVRTRPHTGGGAAAVVGCYSTLWPRMFPQHGAGRKHTRVIRLAAWQAEITRRHPEPLVRGLIHSDGCRYIARQRHDAREYRYTRYEFSNESSEIIRIFCAHLDLVGVHWTMSAPNQVQVARRESVARLEAFIGPKH
jgi:hypothetical protein